MPRPLAYPIKKLIGFDAELWERIRDYRFAAWLNTESDAVRQLIEAGLHATEKSSAASPGRGSRKQSGEPRSTAASADSAPAPRPRKPPRSKAAAMSKEAQIRALRERSG